MNPKWEDKFDIAITDVKDQLDILVYDYDVVTSDDLCGEAVLHLDNLLDSYSHDIWLNLTPQGKIYLRLKFQATGVQDIAFHFSYMFKFLKRQVADLIRIFIDQVGSPEKKKKKTTKKPKK